MPMASQYLFLTASTHESGHLGNTKWLAQQAALRLPTDVQATWHHLARMQMPPFVDLRHTAGQYPMPECDMHTLLQATMAQASTFFAA